MSGIYVKGIELPKDGEHPYWVTIHSDGTVEYNENKGQGWQTSEAVPIPDHGRLGDLDELEQAMRNRKNFVGRLSDPDCLVADAPTIIPASRGDKNG